MSVFFSPSNLVPNHYIHPVVKSRLSKKPWVIKLNLKLRTHNQE